MAGKNRTICGWRAGAGCRAGHLLVICKNCADCSAVVLEQQALKKAVRVAGKRFTRAAGAFMPAFIDRWRRKRSVGWWFKGSAPLATSAVLLAVVAFAWLSRPSAPSATVTQLIDQHVTMLASANPVDVISSEQATR